MAASDDNSVAIVGAGLFGIVTAKVLLHDSNSSFSSITVFEKSSSIGGVWSTQKIYPGLASNSPALTYEIPGFQFPENLRRYGSHVEAVDINAYLNAYAKTYDVTRHVEFNALVEDARWNADTQHWSVRVGKNGGVKDEREFKFLVVCNGMYHAPNILSIAKGPMLSETSPMPKLYHSADVGNPSIRSDLSNSKHTIVVGAGKSAIDLATMLARGEWSPTSTGHAVTLLYKRPHWLSPRSIVRGSIYFERLLFSRFLNAWLPFASNPDALHRWIAESRLGRWSTEIIFRLVADDFIKSLHQQDLPETIPDHSMKEALSGALHVAPEGYLEFVRDGKIKIVEGSVSSLDENGIVVRMNDGARKNMEADSVLYATGYKIAFPFFTPSTLQDLGIASSTPETDPNDLPHLKLHRLLVPPSTVHSPSPSRPCRNIAFNGFAYSLLNPTVSFIAAHWIAQYFQGQIDLPEKTIVDQEIDHFHAWQSSTFAKHGAKGVHIGSHATLYADMLLEDMGVKTGHLQGSVLNPVRLVREWFRPMYPQIYANLDSDLKRAREEKERDEDGLEEILSGSVGMGVVDFFWTFLSMLWGVLVSLFVKAKQE